MLPGVLSTLMCRTGAKPRGSDVLHWSYNVRHNLQKGDVILSRTCSDVSPAAFKDSVAGTIGLGGPRYGTGEAA